MISKIKSFVSLFVLVSLLLIDLILIIIFILCIKESVVGSVVTLVFAAPFLYLTKICLSSVKKHNNSSIELKKDKNENSDADYEIKYVSSEGEETVRQIKVIDFKGRMLEAICFLRHEKRTFAVSRISECIDLKTGELIQEELHFYFNKKYNKNYKISTMFSFEEWTVASFVDVPDLPAAIDGFSVDKLLKMKIVDLESGILEKDFVCEKVRLSLYNENQYYVSLHDSTGKRYNVDLGKVLNVEGVENFGFYLTELFYCSDSGKASVLMDKFMNELSIMTYLGRADSSITPKKRLIMCDYLKAVGACCDDNILSKALRKVKVDLEDFKKAVNNYSKNIPDEMKKNFIAAAEAIVGGREKAKPFGLAGLQYIESKIIV